MTGATMAPVMASPEEEEPMTKDALTAVDRLAELVDAAGGDTSARRSLLDRASKVLAADADADRAARTAVAAAEQRARAAQLGADARVADAEARVRIAEQQTAARQAERAAERAEQAAEAEHRAERAAARRAAWNHRRELAGAAAPATLSMLVYLAAVASAVFGQVSVATGRYGWPTWRALVLAGFIELMALAMALTANRLRIRGERALAPRVLTWVFAGFAATINVWGHWTDPLMAIGLGAASLGGITLWEIRSSARHRDALRTAGQLAEPLPPLGVRLWLLYPAIASSAYRIGVRTRVSLAAAPLVAEAEAQRAARRTRRRMPAAPVPPPAVERVPAGGGSVPDPWDYATVWRDGGDAPVSPAPWAADEAADEAAELPPPTAAADRRQPPSRTAANRPLGERVAEYRRAAAEHPDASPADLAERLGVSARRLREIAVAARGGEAA